MQSKVLTQKILATTLATGILLLPLLARAHGGLNDGDGPEEADGHKAGASALLNPSNPRWWYVFAISTLLTAGLSRLVWKYLQVPAIKKSASTVVSDKK